MKQRLSTIMKISERSIGLVLALLVTMVFCQMSSAFGNDSKASSIKDEEDEVLVVVNDEEDIQESAAFVDELNEKKIDEHFEEHLNNEDDIIEEDQCSRISPKEIFHTELHLRLINILDELSSFVESLLDRMELALTILIPHVKESPIGHLKVEELFPEVRQFLYGSMKEVYDLVRLSWRDLIRVHTHSPNDGNKQLAAIEIVKDAQIQGDQKISASLMELSVTIKAVVLNCIYVIQDTLDMPKDANIDDAATSIARTLPKVAPNFLGTLMLKIMEKGVDKDSHEKILTNTLRSLTGPIEQMYDQLAQVVSDEEAGQESLQDYWRTMIDQCHIRLKEDPLLDSDFEVIYQNEEYLTEVVLGLISSF